jgi:hypothetical protein
MKKMRRRQRVVVRVDDGFAARVIIKLNPLSANP